METVLDTSVYEYVKSNSRFLGYLYYVENEKEIASHKKNLEAKHKHSNHIVYGYRINENQFGYFDGDEPKNSSGMPIYNVIQKNDLYNNAIFVVRYFGGIKLGIGGLIRAYSHTALETIKSGTRHSVVKSAEYTVEIKYDYLNIMLRTLPSQNLKITEKIFEENVLLRIVSDKSYIDQIKKNPSVLKLSVIKDSFYCTF